MTRLCKWVEDAGLQVCFRSFQRTLAGTFVGCVEHVGNQIVVVFSHSLLERCLKHLAALVLHRFLMFCIAIFVELHWHKVS